MCVDLLFVAMPLTHPLATGATDNNGRACCVFVCSVAGRRIAQAGARTRACWQWHNDKIDTFSGRACAERNEAGFNTASQLACVRLGMRRVCVFVSWRNIYLRYVLRASGN